MTKIELLAPAGDLERAYYALAYGADAIYIGGKLFSLRARASNFEIADIAKIVAVAHASQKKVYLVANIICHNFLVTEFDAFFKQLSTIELDGIIVADPFIFLQLRQHYPQFELHVSTQQSITNSKAAAFWKNQGATRVVLAREMTLLEIAALANANQRKIQIEMFIHGAVCIAYSGRCMMSNYFSLRDANVGGCAQSCRWVYEILNRNQQHAFTMSAKDMAYLQHLKSLMQLPIDSFKIEGRMKTINYLTSVIKTYRTAMDAFYKGSTYDYRQLQAELDEVANRLTDDAFLIHANAEKMLYHDEAKVLKQDFAFVINQKIAPYKYSITSKNYFEKNMGFRILSPNAIDQDIKILKIVDAEQHECEIVRTPMTQCIIEIDKDLALDKFCIGKIKND